MTNMVGQSKETLGVREISPEENHGIFLPQCLLHECDYGGREGMKHEQRVDIGLIHLYTSSCLYAWDRLPGYASYIYEHGGTVEQVQACIRHLIVFSGYGPCLAAMSVMKKKGAIPFDTAGKISRIGRGNAFNIVYDGVEASVRKKVYDADPVLEDWIQTHLYGDVYSSPGLTLLQKQYLTVAGLVKSNMMDQLYGHAIAAIRFGATESFLKSIVDMVEHITDEIHGHSYATPAYAKAKRVIDMAVAKRTKSRNISNTLDSRYAIVFDDPSSICIPDPPCSAQATNLSYE